MPSQNEKNWALLIHLSTFLTFVVPLFGFFAPILFWQIKKHDSEFLDQQGREAANFVLTCFVAILFIIAIGTVGLLTSKTAIADTNPVIFVAVAAAYYAVVGAYGVFWFAFTLVAGVKASWGQRYRHRFVIRFFR